MNKNYIINRIVDLGILFQISYLVEAFYHHYWTQMYGVLKKINLDIYKSYFMLFSMIIGITYVLLINRNKSKKENIYLKTCIFFMCFFFSLNLIEYLVHWSKKNRSEFYCIIFCRLPYIILSLNIIAGYYILKIKGISLEKIKSKKTITLTLIYEFFIIFYSLLSLIDYWFIKRLAIILKHRNYFLYKRVISYCEDFIDPKVTIIFIVLFITFLLVYNSYRCMNKSVIKGYILIGTIFIGIYFILTNSAFYIRSFDSGSFVSWNPGFYLCEVFPYYLLAQNISMYFCIQLYKFYKISYKTK